MGNHKSKHRLSQEQKKSFDNTMQSLEDKQIAELKKIYDKFDLDGNRGIDQNELKAMLQKMGYKMSDRQIHCMFTAADKDKNGTIDFNEFVKIAKKSVLSVALRSVFHEIDTDKSGTIDREEMRLAFQKMGHNLTSEEIEAIFNVCDPNGDGSVDFEEFVALMSGERGYFTD